MAEALLVTHTDACSFFFCPAFLLEHVVGITNTIDAGVNIVAPLTKGLFEQTIQMAIQWQVNKNWMFKGKASLDCISMALVAKSWWNPASTISFVIQAGER